MLRTLLATFSFSLALYGGLNSAQAAQAVSRARLNETQLRGLSRQEAIGLVDKVKQAQDRLRAGEPVYFELLSGAPASYPTTEISPRQAFLDADFDRPFDIDRPPIENRLWKPYAITLLPNGPGEPVWDVEVVLGVNDQIERIEMVYRPPAPF